MKNDSAPHTSIDSDDEIDLIEIIKMLWKEKFKIFLVVFISVILSLGYSLLADKQYASYVTFHLNGENSSSSLSSYAGILGMSTNSNLESIIDSLLRSHKIKFEVAKEFKEYYSDTINSSLKKENLKNSPRHINEFIIKKLRLNKKISVESSKKGLIKISYESPDKELSRDVLEKYIHFLDVFNQELKISAEKYFLTIIDPPNEAQEHSKPNLMKNILLSLILSTFLSCIFILMLHSFIKNKS